MAVTVRDSILLSIKKNLGIDPSYTAYDNDVIMHINSAFSNLRQLGAGPRGGYEIEGENDTWEDFLGGPDAPLNNIKTYVTLVCRMWFDPPEAGHHVTAMNEQIQELGFRINFECEGRTV